MHQSVHIIPKYSYRKLALKYHPEKNKTPGAEKKFDELAESYDVLSDCEWIYILLYKSLDNQSLFTAPDVYCVSPKCIERIWGTLCSCN